MADTLTSDSVDRDNDPFGVIGDISPLKCEVCGDPLEYGGRGRRPRFCAAHKRQATKNASGETVNRSDEAEQNARSAVATKLEKSINGVALAGASILLFVAPTDGAIIIKKTPPLAKALGTWGAENKRVRKYIEGTVNSMAAVTVIVTFMDLVLSIMANHGMVPKLGSQKPIATVHPFPASQTPNTEFGGAN